MKLIDCKLYIEFQEMVESGISGKYMTKAKSAETQCWDFIDDPKDKRKVLVQYDTLKDIYKQQVLARFGDPYVRVARTPILNMVAQDAMAYAYYQQYRYNNDQYLPIRVVNKYTRGASWLSMLAKVQADKDIIKKDLGIQKIPDFYTNVAELVKTELLNGKDEQYEGVKELPGDFPYSYQRLLNKVRMYQERGYDMMIDGMWGNKQAAKIGKTENGFDEDLEREQIAVIRHIASKHNNLDAGQVKKLSDIVFEKNGWQTISESRIYQIMQEHKLLLTPGRRGKRVYGSTMAMQHKRVAPKNPTSYWTLDGWTVELLYQDKDRYDNRLVMVVVLDTMNKYPVGYAIGERETAELIREANRNALMHLYELFGDYYYPHQLQSDRYQVKHLTPFYQAVAHLHTPAAVGNAKAKVIEPYFRYLNKHYCQMMPNWSGFNIDAKKTNQVNREMLDKMKTTFPDRAGVMKQIHGMIAYERNQKIGEYTERWAAMPEEQKLKMSRMDWLMVFGQPVGKTNRIAGQGIIKTIGEVSYTFDTFDPVFRQYQNMDWQIVADVEDLSTVLALSPDGKLRYLLELKMELPMDARSTTPEHNAYRKRIADYNKEQEQHITETYRIDAALTAKAIRDIPLSLDDHDEAALKLMLTYGGQQKEAIQDAKGLPAVTQKTKRTPAKPQVDDKEHEWQQLQDDFLRQQTNFNQYLD